MNLKPTALRGLAAALALLCSFYEVNISTTAINIELEKFDEELKKRKH